LWKLYYCFASCIWSTNLSSFSFFSQRTGLYAGWELAFCPPGPLLIEHILMNLRQKFGDVCTARTNARICNLLKLSLSSPTCIKPHVIGRFVSISLLWFVNYFDVIATKICPVILLSKYNIFIVSYF
jgi:hypothetical protein